MLLAALDNAMSHSFKIMDGDELLNDLDRFIEKGGPSPEDYQTFHALMDALAACMQYNQVSHEKWHHLLSKCTFLSDAQSVMGHSRIRPYGYAGDFELLEKIDTHLHASDHGKWDAYTQALPVIVALRKRKRYFKALMESRLPSGGSVLDIASGANRSLYEYFSNNPQSKVVATSVEMEEKAVTYSRHLNRAWSDRIRFVPMNVFRYETAETFDLIWSAHLFDSLSDGPVITLLQKCKAWLKPNGQLVLATLNQIDGQGRHFIENFGNWYLNYRSGNDLIWLAMQAGFSRKNIKVEQEPEGVNLYLHLQN